MSSFSIQKTIPGTVDQVCEKVTEAIKPAGFGVLTRIDFDQKIKEKLNEVIGRTVILGACHPKLALEAFKQSTDVALFIPCNIVVRDLGKGQVLVEALRPTKMLEMIPGVTRSELLENAEASLEKALQTL